MPKILRMPHRDAQWIDPRTYARSPIQSATVLPFHNDPDEDTAGLQRIGKWLELADTALDIDKRRKRA